MHTANVFRVVCGERDTEREIKQGEQSNKNKNKNLFVRRFGLSALFFGRQTDRQTDRQIDIKRKTERDKHTDRCRGRDSHRQRQRVSLFVMMVFVRGFGLSTLFF